MHQKSLKALFHTPLQFLILFFLLAVGELIGYFNLPVCYLQHTETVQDKTALMKDQPLYEANVLELQKKILRIKSLVLRSFKKGKILKINNNIITPRRNMRQTTNKQTNKQTNKVTWGNLKVYFIRDVPNQIFDINTSHVLREDKSSKLQLMPILIRFRTT